MLDKICEDLLEKYKENSSGIATIYIHKGIKMNNSHCLSNKVIVNIHDGI